jgi:hypothetical protein
MVTAICSEVYFSHEKWERLRVLGWQTQHDDIIITANLTFTPMKQLRPAMDETTHPEMADPVMFELLSDHNRISDLCQ